jgi:hypothetical protein
MLKPILLGSAMLIAIPAFAQTATSGSTGGEATATATNDHDPTMDDAMAAEGTTSVSTQVDGGVNTASTGTPTGTSDAAMTAQDDMSAHSGMDHASMGSGQSTTGGASADASTTTAAQAATTGVTGSVGVAGSNTAMSASGVNNGTGLASWRFGSDPGRIGTADYGLAAATGMGGQGSAGIGASGMQGQTGTGYTGMGGPLDIDNQWSSISASGGDLTPLDFGTWLLQQNGQDVERQVGSTLRSRASNLPAIQVLNLTAGAFAQADLNNDMRVSRDELRAFAGM